METAEINALATRFKATYLLAELGGILSIEEIDNGFTQVTKLFDNGQFDAAKKLLDLIDSIIVDILEDVG